MADIDPEKIGRWLDRKIAVALRLHEAAGSEECALADQIAWRISALTEIANEIDAGRFDRADTPVPPEPVAVTKPTKPAETDYPKIVRDVEEFGRRKIEERSWLFRTPDRIVVRPRPYGIRPILPFDIGGDVIVLPVHRDTGGKSIWKSDGREIGFKRYGTRHRTTITEQSE